MIGAFADKAGKLRNRVEPFGWLSRTGPPSEYAECIAPLLTALNWRGEIQQLCESLPHYPDQIDRVDTINTLTNLNYIAQQVTIGIDSFDHRLCPCLVVENIDTSAECPHVLFEGEDGTVYVFESRTRSIKKLSEITLRRITVFTFSPITEESLNKSIVNDQVNEKASRWFVDLLLRFKHVGTQIVMSGLVINLLALVSSLYVMAVYDKVIGSRSPDTLIYLGAGALFAIGFESVLRFLRARSLSFFGVRLDAIVTKAIFERLLFLPPRIIENSSIPTQIARIRDFDSVRNFFAGPVGISVHEIPFTLIFIFTIWVVGGPLVKIPLLLILAYLILGAFMLPRIQRSTEEGAASGVKRQILMVETMRKMRSIKINGLASAWLERFRELSGVSSYTSFRSSMHMAVIESLAYGLGVAASAITLTYGIFLVWDGVITTGGLIASMMLIWRVISPLQATCNALARIRYIFRSVQQVHKLLRTEPEYKNTISEVSQKLGGDIQFTGVGLRYSADRSAVFSGLSLQIKKGEIVTVSGRSGSGKSSFIKLIMALYPPQMGSIRVDGIDIRQRDPVAVRRNIAYVPQNPELFHGSVEQNLRMCRPDASIDDIRQALEQAGALEAIENLESGLNYYIGDYRSEQLPSNLVFQLTLARMYLRDSDIILVDEMPPALISQDTRQRFRRFCRENRGKKTIVYVTDREEELYESDRLVYLTGTGQVLSGDPRELMSALKDE